MFISKAFSSFVIQSDHILQAHQIYDYSHEHENTSKITAAVRKLIKYIILTYSEKSQKTSFRSISRFRFVKFIKYFENWIIIKSVKQAAFRKFREQINHYRQHSIFLKYLHTRHSERSIRSDHDKDIDRKRIESVNEKFFKFISQRKKDSSTSIMTSEIQNAINEIIRQYVAANPSISEFAEFSKSAELSVSAVSFENSKWNASEVEFFDSLYDEKSINIEQVMKHAEKNTYFRNVHFFIERVKNIAIIQDEQHVRDNLFTCLRDFALQWYISKISIEAKQLMKYDDAIDHWTTQLLNRFKESTHVFMNTILKERYIMKDAKRRRKSREYATKILRAVKSTELESMSNQIAIIYNELNVEFRRNLTKSINVLSIDSFLREMNEVKKIWWQLAHRSNYIESSNSKREYQFRQTNEDFNKQYTSYLRSNFHSRNQYDTQFSYTYSQNQSQAVDNRNQQRPQIILSKQSLAIIETNTSFTQNQSIYSNRYTNQDSNRYESYKPKAYQATIENEKNDQFMKEEKTVSINFAKYDRDDNELYYEEQLFTSENDLDEAFVDFVEMKTTCKNCQKVFSSNNKFHKHLKEKQCIKMTKESQQKKSSNKYQNIIETDPDVIRFSTSIKNFEYDLRFRNWNFLKTLIKFFVFDFDTHVCIDIDCEAILDDKKFIQIKCSKIEIHSMTTSLRMREIETTIHETNEYIKILIYMSDVKDDKQVLACIEREIHLINDLKANLLIENDFLKFEEFIIDVSERKATIANCDVTIDLFIRQRDSYVRRNIHVNHVVVVSTEQEIAISIKFSISEDRDFLFESSFKTNVTLYHHVIDSYTSEVIVKNDFLKSVKISKNFRLEMITEITYDDCFLMSSNESHMIITSSISNWIKQKFETFTMLSAKFNKVEPAISSIDSLYQTDHVVNSFMKEIRLINDIMLCENQTAIQAYTKLVNEFLTLWRNEDFINIPEDRWMKLALRNDWQSHLTEKFKIYSFDNENKKVLDETFDELHKQKRLIWTTTSTSFFYSIFVTWRTINEVRKNRAVIDIRDFNKLLVSNAYSLFLQSDIISNLRECSHISVLNVISFFYQWRTHFENVYK